MIAIMEDRHAFQNAQIHGPGNGPHIATPDRPRS